MLPTAPPPTTRLSVEDFPQPVRSATQILDVLSEFVPGQKLVAEIRFQLANGAYRATIAQRDVTLALPFAAKAGDALDLEVVEVAGRMAFAVTKGEAEADADAATAASTSATFSRAGRLIAQLLHDGESAPRSAAQLNEGKPILPAPPRSGEELRPALQGAISRSGMFYESHQAAWIDGKLPAAALREEPQGQLSATVDETAPDAVTNPAPTAERRNGTAATRPGTAPWPPATSIPAGESVPKPVPNAASPAAVAPSAPPLQEIAANATFPPATVVPATAPAAAEPTSTVPAATSPATTTPSPAAPTPAVPTNTGTDLVGPPPNHAPLPDAAAAAPGGAAGRTPEPAAAALTTANASGTANPAETGPTLARPAAAAPQTSPPSEAAAPSPSAATAADARPAGTARTVSNAIRSYQGVAANVFETAGGENVPTAIDHALPPPAGAGPRPLDAAAASGPTVPGEENAQPPSGDAANQRIAAGETNSRQSPNPPRTSGQTISAETTVGETASPVDQAGAVRTTVRAEGLQLPPEVTPLVQQQLASLSNNVYPFHGTVWPGQRIDWEIVDEDGQRREGDSEAARPWTTRLKMLLPTLGGVDATLKLDGGDLAIRLRTDGDSLARLKEGAENLRERLASAGLRLNALDIAPFAEAPEATDARRS